jgi:putative ABC transport system substrate-binding protein
MCRRGDQVNRRTLLAGTAALWPASTWGQQRLPLVVIAALRIPGPEEGFSGVRTVVEELATLGWIDGLTMRVEVVSAEGRTENLAAIAREAVQRRPDVIVANGAAVTGALAAETQTLPIVMSVSAFDPVERGWAKSYNRPGGNITGMTFAADEAADKQIAFLREAAPGIRKLGVLRNSANPLNSVVVRRIEQAAAAAGLLTDVAGVAAPPEVPEAVITLRGAGVDALIAVVDPVMDGMRVLVAEAANAAGLPTAAQLSFYVQAGFLLAYAPDLTDLHRRGAVFVDRILRGARPGDLPIQRPTQFGLTLNMRTARRLRLSIPLALIAQADEVIE